MIGQGSGISAVLDERGDGGKTELFISGGLARVPKGPQKREAKQKHDDRGSQSPGADVWLAGTWAKFGQ
jgi:hypothetical protein